MLELISTAIEAHGGLQQWNRIRRISASFAPGGIAL